MALILMCGLSFAGKSTLAQRLVDGLDAHLVSLDRINEERGLDGGQGIPLEEWANTNRIAHDRVRDLLTDGRHVVVDDTGSPRFIRDEWRRTADTAGSVFALVWVQITPQLQLQRVRANRDEQGRRDVTDAVLTEHAASFEAPVDENALIIAAEDTSVPERVSELVRAIKALDAR
jgi:predicted kinase